MCHENFLPVLRYLPRDSEISVCIRTGMSQALGGDRIASASSSELKFGSPSSMCAPPRRPELGDGEGQPCCSSQDVMAALLGPDTPPPGITPLPLAPRMLPAPAPLSPLPACLGPAQLGALGGESVGQGAGQESFYFYSCHQIPAHRPQPWSPGREGRG